MPDTLRERLRKQLWQIADQIDWLALSANHKSQYYENWTKDPNVGGTLQRYMPIGQVRVYIKDTLLKDYSSARRADPEKPFRMLGLQEDISVSCVFVKPHGRLLSDGRVISWGRAADWKIVFMAVFERSFTPPGRVPHAAVLTESAGRFSEPAIRSLVAEAAKRLQIEKVVWDS